LGVVLGLSSVLSSIFGASAEAASRPAPRHRHRHRSRPAQPEPNRPPDVAHVTLTTAAKGTSFYVDSRRVGTGSRVRQSLPPGYHQFQAVHPSGARWQKYLSFEAGDDRELIIHW
jgi:hypothetical protein